MPVGIVNLSRGQAAARIVERVRRSPLFDVRLESRRSLDYLYPLKKGDVKAMLVFRDALDRRRSLLKYPEVQVLMDGIDSNTSMIAAGYFNGIIKQYILDDMEKLGRRAAAGRQAPFSASIPSCAASTTWGRGSSASC